MASRIANYDWSQTPLGDIDHWSPSLRTAIDLCLGSRMCSCIYWGTDNLILYNDAYGSILGTKHPWALGRTAQEVWPEIIEVIGPLMQKTLETGETTGGDDVAIFLNRSGYVEEFYCSFSYSPIYDHQDSIEGVFAVLPETSVRVIGERRLRTLQKLGVDARAARSPQQALEIVRDQAVAARESVAGVNLDEEAANLIKFQQSYQASARLIQTANQLFDTIVRL